MKPTIKRKPRNHQALAADWINIKNAFAELATDATQVAEEMVSQTIEEIQSQPGPIQENVRAYTAKNPLRAISCALIVGFALGYWIKK